MHLPFCTEGSTIFFDSANPSNADLECSHIILTSDAKWKPQDGIMTAATHPTDDDDNSDKDIYHRLVNTVQVTGDLRHVDEILTSTRHSKFMPKHISNLFNVSISKSKEILFITTQRGIWTMVQPLN